LAHSIPRTWSRRFAFASFANPAVTLARGFTTTFAGIAINHVPGFVVAQLVGAAIAALVAPLLFSAKSKI
jgi:glycerol uptake facilitator-like aquaporin